VVSFDRPGFGYSDPFPYTTATVARVAGRIADALGIDQFPALGFSMGGPYPLAAAAELPERVTAVGGVIASYGPFDKVPYDPASASAVLAEAFAEMVTFGTGGPGSRPKPAG
jgi:pimeloyl-ACP methyl ester carboxylesterase